LRKSSSTGKEKHRQGAGRESKEEPKKKRISVGTRLARDKGQLLTRSEKQDDWERPSVLVSSRALPLKSRTGVPAKPRCVQSERTFKKTGTLYQIPVFHPTVYHGMDCDRLYFVIAL
jgi:hypothetical protein